MPKEIAIIPQQGRAQLAHGCARAATGYRKGGRAVVPEAIDRLAAILIQGSTLLLAATLLATVPISATVAGGTGLSCTLLATVPITATMAGGTGLSCTLTVETNYLLLSNGDILITAGGDILIAA